MVSKPNEVERLLQNKKKKKKRKEKKRKEKERKKNVAEKREIFDFISTVNGSKIFLITTSKHARGFTHHTVKVFLSKGIMDILRLEPWTPNIEGPRIA